MKKDAKMPEFYAAIVFEIPANIEDYKIRSFFGSGIKYKTLKDYNIIEIVYKEIKKYYCWDVDEVLSKLFESCNLEFVTIIKSELKANILIDIAYYHKTKHPGLLFDGRNMKLINDWNAKLSIDVY